jgi:hypothetical protein
MCGAFYFPAGVQEASRRTPEFMEAEGVTQQQNVNQHTIYFFNYNLIKGVNHDYNCHCAE